VEANDGSHCANHVARQGKLKFHGGVSRRLQTKCVAQAGLFVLWTASAPAVFAAACYTPPRRSLCQPGSGLKVSLSQAKPV
jgi:hypothetical protein